MLMIAVNLCHATWPRTFLCRGTAVRKSKVNLAVSFVLGLLLQCGTIALHLCHAGSDTGSVDLWLPGDPCRNPKAGPGRGVLGQPSPLC